MTQITWQPSVYIPGRGVVMLNLDEVKDMCAAYAGAEPKTEIAKTYFCARRSPKRSV